MKLINSLVIGYGNSLRSDDRLGIAIAETVASWNLPNVRSLTLHQLTIELASELAQVDLVIFVDACQSRDLNVVKLQALKPLDYPEFRTHFCEPAAILTITQAVYEKCPLAWWLTAPGVNFEFGECLSSIARQNLSQALIQIRGLIPNLADQNSCMKSA